MTEREENREVTVEVPADGRPRVMLNGEDVSAQVVGPDGSVRIDQPGMSLRIQAATGEGKPPPLPEGPTSGTAPGTAGLPVSRAQDDAQAATVIQTQTVTVAAGGNVNITLTQNAQVSQNQAHLVCRKRRRRAF